MTMFIIALALLGRVTEWEHYPHYGGGNCIINYNGLVLAGTSGGILFSHYSPGEDKLVADSGWTAPGDYPTTGLPPGDRRRRQSLGIPDRRGIDVFSPEGTRPITTR